MSTFIQVCLYCFSLMMYAPYCPVTPTAYQTDAILIEVPLINQNPDLPTGCEATAASMVLQYYGENIEATYFASEWLDCEIVYAVDETLYGPDPNEQFAGDPFSEYGLGCYAGAIEKAINANSMLCEAKAIYGVELEQLIDQYIDEGKPLVVWATLDLKAPQKGNSWYLEDGSLFTWKSQEHCMVLVGYNDRYYFVNDPQTGTCVQYPKFLFEMRYIQMGLQAVVIELI